MFRPMLAPPDGPQNRADYFEKLSYPLMGSPKIDGIRCIVKNDPIVEFGPDFESILGPSRWVCKSRTYIDLPSQQVQSLFSVAEELDGELVVGDETAGDVYNVTESHVMSADKPADEIKLRVFDCADETIAEAPFELRHEIAAERALALCNPKIEIVKHEFIKDVDELLAYEEVQLLLGYEGVMLRAASGPYKHGRGTFKEGYIYKLKRFEDTEGILVDIIERQLNLNEDTRSNLGYAKRSQSKEGKIGAATVGKFLVEWEGKLLRVATGKFTHPQLQEIWDNFSKYKGNILKFRYMKKGMKDLPRHPRALGWRSPIDM